VVGEIIISGDDEEGLVTKITTGDLDLTMAGTITNERRQIGEGEVAKGTTLKVKVLGNSGDVEVELVLGHDGQ